MAAMQDFRNPYLNREANNRLLAASSVGDLATVRELTTTNDGAPVSVVGAPDAAFAAAQPTTATTGATMPSASHQSSNNTRAAADAATTTQTTTHLAYPLYRGEGGSSPIHLAAGENHFNVVQFLVETLHVPVDYGDAHGATALHYACSMKCLEVMNYLLERQHSNVNAVDDSGETPLHDACGRGDGGGHHGNTMQAVQRLLQVPGIKVNHVSQARLRPLDICLQNERNDIAQLFLDYGEHASDYLHVAAKNGTSLGAVRFLLRSGANVTYEGEYGCTALHFACSIKEDHLRVPMVRLLLEAGSNPTQLNQRHWTPLHAVCKEGKDLEVLQLMLEFKNVTNVNCVAREGATPLHIACALGGGGSSGGGDPATLQDNVRCKMIELLLANGADINARDERGRTPLHRACANNSCTAARALLNSRSSSNSTNNSSAADINAVDAKGKSPFSMARKANRWDLMEVFLESGRLGEEQVGPDRHGRTLLHHACYKGRLLAVKWLLQYYNNNNADLLARTHDGLTAIQVAAIYKRRDIVFFLLHERNNQIIPHPRL